MLADQAETEQRDEEARSYLEEALELAFATKDGETIFQALQRLGWFDYLQADLIRLGQGDPAEAQVQYRRAAVYFQRSLVYGTATWPHHFVSTLGLLAMAWGKVEDTYPAALGIYDWLYHLNPESIEPLLEKYECLAQWRREDVRLLALRKRCDTPFDAVVTVAANWALGRKQRAYAVARIGLDLAKRGENAVLTDLLTHFLS